MRLLATWLIVYATTTEPKVLRYLATYVGYVPLPELEIVGDVDNIDDFTIDNFKV